MEPTELSPLSFVRRNLGLLMVLLSMGSCAALCGVQEAAKRLFAARVCDEYPDPAGDADLFARYSYPVEFLNEKVKSIDGRDGAAIDRLVVGGARYNETWSASGDLLSAQYLVDIGPLLGPQDWSFGWDEERSRWVGYSDRTGADVHVRCDARGKR